ncbi:hypothetical protein LEP1GSC034_1100 [Leptospira interrogans str. 2003000735]|uniref:Uncharacterized protein n=3 Tax=Leptospira interrogans TaxID=173 RepID=A0A829D7K3_LEPIR|nr:MULTISPECIES: hypothetical protein [Leptospira]EMY04945.1 hypothetical protein LEP1GSC029_1811 [Leptospira interrogans str. 2002000626]ALE41633.1 hypothetical protein G436_4503 [Leptospira interrogans serovar Hardjo str. Norma]ALO02469.1 hypothetical protein LIH_19200 [Leptospira interrogans serovar Hardjo-prajitno]EKN89967.1 hypothetical protein LEP1GSC027_1368 [Leptospira interrogans str. 2002000624]EKO94573.1 hypothetical protein LEP1GSC057_2516 [Leptospira interrogans str. Brem 329]
MLEPQSPELKVADYNTALQLTQSLEARNDFQYKKIHKLLLIISDWTDKFVANKVLPNVDQLSKELGLEKDKTLQFLKELCTKYNPPIIKKICMVDLNPNGDISDGTIESCLKMNPVFARPQLADTSTSHRYVDGVNQLTFNSISRWIRENRTSLGKNEFIKWIHSAISENKLSSTYASTEIGNLFKDPFDVSPELKQITINIHLKPVLKKLVEQKVLFFFRNEQAVNPGNRSVFYYNIHTEILNRIEAYKVFLMDRIVPELQKIGAIGVLSDEEKENTRSLVNSIMPYLSPAYGDQKTAVEELMVLLHVEEEDKEKKEKEEKKVKLVEIVDYIKSANRLVDLNFLRFRGQQIEEEIRTLVANHDQILHTEFADKNTLYHYVLHKLAISGAIEAARKTFASTGNDNEIRILDRMRIRDFIEDKELVTSFDKLEISSLFKYLPFFTRLWRNIFGNVTVHKSEADQIKAHNTIELNKKIVEVRSKKIQEDATKLAEKRLKEKDAKELAEKNVRKQQAANLKQEKTQTTPKEIDPQGAKLLERILDILDDYWSNQQYPDRNILLYEMDGEIDEDGLINFLKKFGKNDIYSFMVRNQEDKYTFPILITKRYLKKKGKELLEKASSVIDEQKNASMPDQDLFDFCISLEAFLRKTLPKI